MTRPARLALRRLAQISLAAIVGIVGLPVLTAGNNVANAVETAQCATVGNVFVGMANSNDFRLRKQSYPADGYNNWASDDSVGSGWNERFMAGPNGYLWYIQTNGELRRHRWTGSTWDFGGVSQLIGTGWFGWDLPAYHFRVTVDSNNLIYTVDDSGSLKQYKYNETTKQLTSKVVAPGWNKYDQIFASGDGVIYARNPSVADGQLTRYKYNHVTGKWFNYDTGQWQDEQVGRSSGAGWNMYRQLSSPGGDIVYGTFPGGETWWYRYMPKYNFWEINASGEDRARITTWSGVDEIAPAIDTCRTADLASDVDCAANAKIWGSTNSDQLWLRAHNEPETGLTSWQKPTNPGSGWNGNRFMAGAKGYKFFIKPNGEMRTHRWIDSTPTVPGHWADNAVSQLVATGWLGWDQLPYHNRVTVDANNHIYAALGTGELEFNTYDEATKTLTNKQVIDTGWGRFDQVFAAGDGVLYARDPNIDGGTLFRFHYDWKNRRWIEYGRNVGYGWNWYTQILSPGGDVIYGVHGDEIWWYRYDNTAKVFATTAEGEPKKRVSWWTDLKEVMVDIDACKLTNPDKITAPQTPAPAVDKAEMIYNEQKSRFEIAYSDENGTLRELYQNVPNSETLVLNALSSTGFTGRATIAQREDNKVVVQARGTNAQVKSFLEPVVNPQQWSEKNINGALNSSPVLVRGTNKVLTSFAVDGENKLWYSEQFGINGEFKPWRQATAPDTYNMTGEMTVVPAGDGFEIAYTEPTGTVVTKRFANGALSTSRVAAGITGVGAPAAVVFADGKVQLVVRASNNKLYTQKEGASGFTGWADISGAMTFTGTPEAVLNKFNIVEVVARDTFGSIHRGGQTAPGATTWRMWADTGISSPFEVTFAKSTGNEQRIFANSGDGNYYLIDSPPYASNQSQAMSTDAATSLDKTSKKVPATATKQSIK